MKRAVLTLEIVVDRAAFWFWRNLNTFTIVVTLNQSSVCVSSGYASAYNNNIYIIIIFTNKKNAILF